MPSAARSTRPGQQPAAATTAGNIIRRGDVVVMRSPRHAREQVIKRVIATEGDIVAVPGRLQGEEMEEGRMWVEGDNGLMSLDSRSAYGGVPMSLVEGRALLVVWPLFR